MKNYKQIRRIFEQEAIAQDATAEISAGANPHFDQGEDQPQMPMDMPQDALPAPGETATPIDTMSMTVRDFVEKCRAIDPLVCMGIESFITKNQAAFVEPTAPQMPAEQPMDQDMTFSNVVNAPMPPAPAQNFSLEQSPETLNFPQ